MINARKKSMESLISSDEAVSRAMKNENKSQDRYPFCIVWTKLPCVTWLLPFIGHVGIGDSKGRIWDFAGSYYVGVCYSCLLAYLFVKILFFF